MSETNISIGESELEIMKVLWSVGKPLDTRTINEAVRERKWKRTTISTFLTRLVQKGAVSCEKKGNLYYYSPVISAKEYKKLQTKSLIKTLYNGSIRDFAASLFEEGQLTEEDIRELKAMFVDRG